MFFICKHKWKVLDKTIFPSAFEQVREKQQTVKSLNLDDMNLFFFSKKVIIILICEKCGKEKEILVQNPA